MPPATHTDDDAGFRRGQRGGSPGPNGGSPPTAVGEAGAGRRPDRRAVVAAAVVVLLALGLLAGGALLGSPTGDPSPASAGNRAAAIGLPSAGLASSGRPGPAVGSSADLAAGIARAQARLARLPGDWPTWADLGLAYVQQARLTGDPTYYAKAEGALARSLRVRRDGNHLALAGQGVLAAARHDFAAALTFGRRAVRIAPYAAIAHSVVVDALIELGRYDEAWPAVQRMVDLGPDTGALARAAYAVELRGDVRRAGELLAEALDVAPSPADAGYALYYLGELAYHNGDLATAGRRWAEGMRRAPDYLPLLAGRARIAAARGRYGAALADYRALVARLPQPGYLIEYAELLAARGKAAEAAAQLAVVRAQQRIFASQGVGGDTELVLFEADHGSPARAVAAARADYRHRHSVRTEDAYGWALHAAGRDRKALPHARAALRLGTRSALAHYHLGMIEAELGDAPAAARHLSTALRLNPHFSALHAPRARAALDRLRSAR